MVETENMSMAPGIFEKVRLFDHSFASMAIYGSLTVMAVLVANDETSPLALAAQLFGVTVAIAMAKAYSEILAGTLLRGRKLAWKERKNVLRNVTPVLFGAQGPTLVLLISAFGLFSVDKAIEISKILVLLLLFAYGLRVAQLLHRGLIVQIVSGLAIMSAGIVVVLVNYLFH